MATEQKVEANLPEGDIFFVQIGSNDGMRSDPIFKLAVDNPRWRGLLVEPVVYMYNRLRANYRYQRRFAFENAAINHHDGTTTFYTVSTEAEGRVVDLPSWYDQIGSLYKDHILKHLDGRLEPFIEATEVPCLSLCSLLRKHAVSSVDLIHIDAEGFDASIMEQIDLLGLMPKVMVYEHWHMSRAQASIAASRLQNRGYKLSVSDLDTIAVLT